MSRIHPPILMVNKTFPSYYHDNVVWLTCWKVAWTRLAGNMLLKRRTDEFNVANFHYANNSAPNSIRYTSCVEFFPSLFLYWNLIRPKNIFTPPPPIYHMTNVVLSPLSLIWNSQKSKYIQYIHISEWSYDPVYEPCTTVPPIPTLGGEFVHYSTSV